MAEYIERDKLLYEFREIMPDIGVNELADKLYNVALDLPAADVAEVKRGKWVKSSVIKCSVCGSCTDIQSDEAYEKFIESYYYCPVCGSKLDLED